MAQMRVHNFASAHVTVEKRRKQSCQYFSRDTHLQTSKAIITVRGVNVVQIDTGSFHFRVCAKRQLAQALQLHDVHLAAKMFGQVSVYPERYLTVCTLERPRVAGGRRAKRRSHADLQVSRDICVACMCSLERRTVYLIVMGNRSLVLRQVTLGSEGDGAALASEWPLKVMNVDMQPQLTRLAEHLVANATHAPAVLGHTATTLHRISSYTDASIERIEANGYSRNVVWRRPARRL